MTEAGFLDQLLELVEYGKIKDSRLSKKEINDYFSEMKLTKEQMDLVYAYMKEHNIEVAGSGAKNVVSEEMTTTDSAYLRVYKKEINQLIPPSPEELKKIYEQVAKGEENAITIAIESHLKAVVKLASKYKNHGVLLEDLIQEGNLTLVEVVSRLLGNGQPEQIGKLIDKAIRTRMIELCDEEMDIVGKENSLLAKTNLVYNATNLLAEELGKVATIDELAEYTKMTEKEIYDIADVAIEEIQIGQCEDENE